jgi:diguanylate cyclase (GGDEF)-like protein
VQPILALLFVLCHAIAVALFQPDAMAVSYVLLAGAPLIAALAAFLRCRDIGFSPSLGWSTMLVAMLLWAGGMVLSLRQDVFFANTSVSPGDSMLLYILYGVPLTFAIANSGEREYGWTLRLIDGVLVVALGYLYFVHTFSLTTVHGTSANADALSLVRMFDVENGFIALFAAIRYMAATERNERHFFRSLTIYAVVYMVVAAYNNHVIAFEPDNAIGHFADLLLDIPFLVFFVVASRPARARVATPASMRLERIVHTASPLAMALALLIVASFVMSTNYPLGMAGVALAVVGFGLRSTLAQVRSSDARDRLDALARMDGLTGVANRRQFDESLANECRRLTRSGDGLALLMIDIDHFKQLNDALGHQKGDAYLCAVARTIAEAVSRSPDLVARYGGEEFAVLLPSTTFDGALALAERIRAAVEAMDLPAAGPPGRLTISVGVGFVGHADVPDAPSLLSMADRALYEAKRLGRNQVRLAPEPG